MEECTCVVDDMACCYECIIQWCPLSSVVHGWIQGTVNNDNIRNWAILNKCLMNIYIYYNNLISLKMLTLCQRLSRI